MGLAGQRVLDASGNPVKSYDNTTESDKVLESSPVSAHHVESTLLELTNIAQNTTAYGYIDMDGYRYLGIQGLTSGAAPTDILTVTVEATIQDDGTAQASCTYTDVTTSWFGVASAIDNDFYWMTSVPVIAKYVRVKYTTSAGGGNDCDLTVYVKKMF